MPRLLNPETELIQDHLSWMQEKNQSLNSTFICIFYSQTSKQIGNLKLELTPFGVDATLEILNR